MVADERSAGRSALVVGATGLVGGHLVDRLTSHPAYASVVTLGRKKPASLHKKLQHFLFGDADAGQAYRVDVAFCCLGTTIRRAGSKDKFREVDLDLVVEIAQRARDSGAGTFIVVSSLGADASSGNFYLRTKGEMEQAVIESGPQRVGIVRPSLLLGQRDELRAAEAVGQIASRLINPVLFGPLRRYRAVEASEVAAAMIGLDQSVFTGTRLVESGQLDEYTD